MKYLLIILMIMPFGLLSQTNIIEPELVSDEFTIKGDWGNYIYQKHIFKNKLYFTADDGIHGSELWVTDGSPEGTFMLKDITPNGNSNVFIMKANLDKLVFVVKDISGKSSLWSTDGTREGTTFLAKINVQIGNGINFYEKEFQEYKGKIIFQADDGIHGTEPWISDGTAEGTYMIQDLGIDGGSNAFYFTNAGDKCIFVTNENVGYASVIWSTNGSKNSCHRIYQGDGHAIIENVSLNGLTLITTSIRDPITNNGYTSMSVSDGTLDGTIPILGENKKFGGIPILFTEFKNKIYFSSFNGGDNRLYSTNGTNEGTKIEYELNSKINFITTWKDKLIVRADYANIYISDGTAKDTIAINSLYDNSIYYGQPSIDEENIYLLGSDGDYNRSLWRTDGTKEGIQKLKDISSYPDKLTFLFENNFDGNKLFSTYINQDGGQLWMTNGTEQGTKQFEDFSVLPNFKRFSFRLVQQFGEYLIVITNYHDIENYMFLINKDEVRNRIEPANTNKLNKFALKTGPEMIGVMNGDLYFVANYFDDGEQLWRIKVSEPLNSVEEQAPQPLLTLYPNPAEDFVQIDIRKPMQLSVISSTGAVVKDCGIVADGKVQVSELSAGVYFIVDDNGNNIAKFVKE